MPSSRYCTGAARPELPHTCAARPGESLPRSSRSPQIRQKGLRSRLQSYAVGAVDNSSANQQGVDLTKAREGVLIVGAGIAGLATAAALRRVGIPAVVVERDPGPRREGSAIALWTNAFRALDALGVAQPLRDAHPLLQSVEIATPSGQSLRRFTLDECGGGPHEFRGVLRSSLLDALEAAAPKNCIAYNTPIASIEDSREGPAAVLENGVKIHAKVILGADGSRSSIASALKLPPPNYAGYSAYRGVAELKGGLPIPKDTVRQMLGPGVRAGLYALSPSTMYWFVTMPGPAARGPPPDHYQEDALSLVKGWQCGIAEAIQNTPKDSIKRNRIVDRWLLPNKAFGNGCVTLLGDAVHPMTPNLGQGGCTALEDAVVLAQTLRDASAVSDVPLGRMPSTALSQALRNYERKRSSRVTKITVRSNLMGLALGSSISPICAVRDAVVKSGVFIPTFMNHTTYDCGQL